MSEPYRVCVVCTGNICRSPMGEFILRELFEEAGLGDRVVVDSAGTTSWEVGNPADPRTLAVLERNGHADFGGREHVARAFEHGWLAERDLVLAADVIAGSPLQMSTLLGEPLLIASRFYGIGNSALALFCTALVFLLGVVCQAIGNRWVRLTTVLATTLAACILLATPGLGTKFGSVPTLIIGVAYLALASAGIRFSLKRLGLTVGIIVHGLDENDPELFFHRA